MNHLTRLVAHLAWADAEVLSGLRAAKNVEPACHELFAHILGAEALWFMGPTIADRWRGRFGWGRPGREAGLAWGRTHP